MPRASKMPSAKKMSDKEKLQKTIDDQAKQIDDLKNAELASVRKTMRFQEAEQAVNEATSKISGLRHALHEKDREIEGVKKEKREAKGEANDYNEAYNKEHATVIRLEKQVEELKATGGDGKLKRKHDKLEKENEELHEKIDGFKVDNETMRDNLAKAEKERKDAVAARNTVELQLAAREGMYDELNEKFEKANRENAKLKVVNTKLEQERDYFKEALGKKTDEASLQEQVKQELARVVTTQRVHNKAMKECKEPLQKIVDGTWVPWAAVETCVKTLANKGVYRDVDDTRFAYPTTDAAFVANQLILDTKLYAKLLSIVNPHGEYIHNDPHGAKDLVAYGKRLDRTVEQFKLVWDKGPTGKRLRVENGEVITADDDE